VKHLQNIGILAVLSIIAGGVTYILFPNKRNKIVKAALGEVGKADLVKYWTDTYGQYEPEEWCGVFALWALHQGGIAKSWKWEVGKGFLYKLPTTLVPKPGDIAYLTKNQHEAVVIKVNNDIITLANGNGWNHVVSLSTTPRSDITAFYSIEGLL
jgi:hypothetical protein